MIEVSGDVSYRRRRVVLGSSAAGLAVVAAAWIIWWNRPPQMGADDEVFAAVDALFTAVTARDEKLLGQCEERLCALKESGKLPDAASDYLNGDIKMAREGRWQAAAERLYDFMKAQERLSANGQKRRRGKE
jgi:hypothetical protein